MTPFQQFRVWNRRATAGAKASSMLGAVLAVALIAWLVAPIASGGSGASQTASLSQLGSNNQQPSGTQTGSTTTPGTSTLGAYPQSGQTGQQLQAGPNGGTNPVGTPGVSSGPPVLPGTTGSPRPRCAPGGDQGVGATEIHVVFGLVDVAGVGALLGIPSTGDQQRYWNEVISDANKNGGFACRKLVPSYVKVNALDPSTGQKTCLDIASSKPFAYVDAGGYLNNSAKECFPVNKIPFVGAGGTSNAEIQKFSPYFLTVGGTLENTWHNAFQAFKKYSYFTASNGFKKLGMIYRDCNPDTEGGVEQQMSASGIDVSKLVKYDVGCNTSGASASDLQQAVLKFKNAGVTHLVPIDFAGDLANFTKTAQQQGFRPKYYMPDYGYIAETSSGSSKPNATNLDGAVVTTVSDYGYETSGLPLQPGTKRCNKIMQAAGEKPVYQQPVGFGGVICNLVWLLQDALNGAPSVTRTSLVAGANEWGQEHGRLEYSWPSGPADYSKAGTATGGQFWRRVQFHADCTCFKIVDSQFQPSFR